MTLLVAGAPHPGSLLKELDLDKAAFVALIDRARQLKLAKSSRTETPRLIGKQFALIFEKNSTRTRCAFEVAAADQGARTTYLGPDGSHIGRDESIADTARVLGRMFDGIEFRGFSQDSVEQLAAYAGVPVWNGLTDSWHPTQMLADILTMTEHHGGPIEDIGYCFIGDGRNNVARSLLVTGALLGMDARIVAPPELSPPDDLVTCAQELAATSHARILVSHDVESGVAGVDFIYTDVWVSMGESPTQWDSRLPLLLPYQVTPRVMHASGKPTTKFMHCLPSVHDCSTELGQRLHDQYGVDAAEVTDSVFESPNSIVFDQAENRLHTIKALLVQAFPD
jgi:ornithine carbamoyltransferase